jgi:hypothetical protein
LLPAHLERARRSRKLPRLYADGAGSSTRRRAVSHATTVWSPVPLCSIRSGIFGHTLMWRPPGWTRRNIIFVLAPMRAATPGRRSMPVRPHHWVERERGGGSNNRTASGIVTKRNSNNYARIGAIPAIAVAHAGGERPVAPGAARKRAREGRRQGGDRCSDGEGPLRALVKEATSAKQQLRQQAWCQKIQPQRERKHSSYDETHFAPREPFPLAQCSISRWRDWRTVGDFWSRRSCAFGASGLDVMEFRVLDFVDHMARRAAESRKRCDWVWQWVRFAKNEESLRAALAIHLY